VVGVFTRNQVQVRAEAIVTTDTVPNIISRQGELDGKGFSRNRRGRRGWNGPLGYGDYAELYSESKAPVVGGKRQPALP
jgi:hypothetical protein